MTIKVDSIKGALIMVGVVLVVLKFRNQLLGVVARVPVVGGLVG